MKRKLFCVLTGAALVLSLASCGESKDEKQIKNDLAGKSNQEVVDYVVAKAGSKEAVEAMTSSKGVKASLKEKVKMNQKMGELQDMEGEGEASAEFVFEYEKGFSLKGNVTANTKGKYNGSSIDMKVSAKAEVYYSIAEDILYLNANAKIDGTNGEKPLGKEIGYKGKILDVSEQFKKDVEIPDSTIPGTTTTTAPSVSIPDISTPDFTIPEGYNEIIESVTELVASYKEKLNYSVEDDQVKIGLDLTKDDINSLLSSSLMTQIINIAGLEAKDLIVIKGVIALESTVFSSSTKVGFDKNYLLRSAKNDLKAAVKYENLDISVENSFDLNVDYGNYSADEVKNKDSYTAIIEIPSDIPSVI